MMANEHIVFVYDERDSFKKWMHEIRDIEKYSSFRAKFSACNVQDIQKRVPLKPTKVIFFLVGDSNSLTELLRLWIKRFEEQVKKRLQYCVIYIQEELTSCNKVDGTEETNIIRIRNIAEIYSWWPKLSLFLFGHSKTSTKTCFLWNMTPKYKRTIELTNFLEKGLRDVGIELADSISAAKCILCVTRRGTVDVASPAGVALRTAKMEGRPVHAFIFRVEEVTDEIIWSTSYPHSVFDKRPLRAFLCILADLQKINIKILDHAQQQQGVLPPPAAPFHFHCKGGGDYVELVWQEAPTSFPSSLTVWHFIVEIRVITRCLTKSSEWTVVHKEPSSGPGTRHVVVLRDLHRGRPFQFRIYAACDARKSKTRETNVFYPSGETTVNDPNGCMASCMNKKRFCDCIFCVLTCGFTIWRHQLL